MATSFAGKLAPAGVGGMALNVRFLQKQGVDRPVAVSGVGLSTVAGAVAHVSLIGVFILWAGPQRVRQPHPARRPLVPDRRSRWRSALAGIGLALPYTRHLLTRKLWPVLRRAFDGVGHGRCDGRRSCSLLLGGSVAHDPRLPAGRSTSPSPRSVASLPFATVGAVYLVGSAVASAAPTPGGLGALEAALIGGFVAAGLSNDVAVPAVFLFRLATFWLPILPGWICFTWLQRRDYL